MSQAMEFFKVAEQFVQINCSNELLRVESRRFEDQTADTFLTQYTYVVFNSGMRNQIALKILQRFIDGGSDPNLINHPSKRKAIKQAQLE